MTKKIFKARFFEENSDKIDLNCLLNPYLTYIRTVARKVWKKLCERSLCSNLPYGRTIISYKRYELLN